MMDEQTEWINVKDRLPDRSYQTWLVYRNIPGFNPGYDIAEWDEVQQEWYTWSDIAEVLYWMPVPILPIEAQEKA